MGNRLLLLGRMYEHANTRKVLRLVEASREEIENFARLVEPEMYPNKTGFALCWHGTIDEFFEEWTLKEVE